MKKYVTFFISIFIYFSCPALVLALLLRKGMNRRMAGMFKPTSILDTIRPECPVSFSPPWIYLPPLQSECILSMAKGVELVKDVGTRKRVCGPEVYKKDCIAWMYEWRKKNLMKSREIQVAHRQKLIVCGSWGLKNIICKSCGSFFS